MQADICIIGAGTAGLVTAAVAAQLGARTVLFERGRMGGDCLNYGCVPSKALLAAAKAAKAVREAGRFGVTAAPAVDFAAVMRHVHGAIAAIAPHDSVERFRGLGVRVVQSEARFTRPAEVQGGGLVVGARRFVIAAGSAPAVPPITGLDRVAFLTNETIFDNAALPRHLVIIGGGPIGVELAQAHRLLGAQVSVLEAARILPKDDPELVRPLREQLEAEGIAIRENAAVKRVEQTAEGIAVVFDWRGGEERIAGSHLLVAAGRRPNTAGLDLERAGVAYGPKGIEVDARLRTSNPRIYAIGDVVGGPQFTHIAEYHAGIVVRNALFRLPARVDYRALPWVTYTEPELAQVGATEGQARRQYGEGIRVLRHPFAELDRAQIERETIGLIKVIARPSGRILGASILGAHAGELIQPWAVAIGNGLKLSALATMIAPYPTFGEITKKAAASWYTPKLFGAWSRRLVGLLARFDHAPQPRQ